MEGRQAGRKEGEREKSFPPKASRGSLQYSPGSLHRFGAKGYNTPRPAGIFLPMGPSRAGSQIIAQSAHNLPAWKSVG